MKRTIVTGCSYSSDEWRQIADLTWPTQADYANRIGVSFLPLDMPPHPTRAASWMKLACIADAFVESDEVLWLDADVAVVDGSESLFDVVPDGFEMALASLKEADGDRHYNCGVWLLRRASLPLLASVAMDDSCIGHKWWEQAAANKLANEKNTWTLGEEWNHWTGSPGEIAPRFRHACGIRGPRRIEVIKGWVRECQQ
jgi:hypothetical protein